MPLRLGSFLRSPCCPLCWPHCPSSMVVSMNPDLNNLNSQNLRLAFIEPTQITYLFWINLFERDQYEVTGHFLKLDQSSWQREREGLTRCCHACWSCYWDQHDIPAGPESRKGVVSFLQQNKKHGCVASQKNNHPHRSGNKHIHSQQPQIVEESVLTLIQTRKQFLCVLVVFCHHFQLCDCSWVSKQLWKEVFVCLKEPFHLRNSFAQKIEKYFQ